MTKEEIDGIIEEFLTLKKEQKKDDARIGELQNQIKDYMQKEGLTRLFGGEGLIAQKTIQRFSYDWEKVKALLSPFGKWEEVLKVDETKLKRALKEIPEETRAAIATAREVSKEYSVISAKFEKIRVHEGSDG